jgi:hypothetical protein
VIPAAVGPGMEAVGVATEVPNVGAAGPVEVAAGLAADVAAVDGAAAVAAA